MKYLNLFLCFIFLILILFSVNCQEQQTEKSTNSAKPTITVNEVLQYIQQSIDNNENGYNKHELIVLLYGMKQHRIQTALLHDINQMYFADPEIKPNDLIIKLIKNAKNRPNKYEYTDRLFGSHYKLTSYKTRTLIKIYLKHLKKLHAENIKHTAM